MCPRTHGKKIRTVPVVERLHAEVKRRTRGARLLPHTASCEQRVTPVVIHNEWIVGKRYLSDEGDLRKKTKGNVKPPKAASASFLAPHCVSGSPVESEVSFPEEAPQIGRKEASQGM